MIAEKFTVTDALGTIEYLPDGIDWVAIHSDTAIYGCGSTTDSAREDLLIALRQFADAIDGSERISDVLVEMRARIAKTLDAPVRPDDGLAVSS